ncbi:MAG: YkgJ family cysteine cluster protein [Promethearchaeota archaeon]
MQNLRFVCTRCGNCCTDKDTLVNLTYLDILRIKDGLKLDLEEMLDIVGFYIFDKTISEENEKRMVVSPIETERGLAFVALRKNSLGGCYFYNSINKKCLIYNIRPILCRTFPFSFRLLDEKNNDNNIQIIYTEKGKQYCPGIKNEAPLINYEEWIKLGKKTLEELKVNHKVIKEWNKKVKRGKIIPTTKKFLNILFKLNDF